MRKFISEQLNKNDHLIKHSLIVFIATGIASLFNYIYQLYMGRVLGPVEYGELGALFAIYYSLNVPSGTVQTVVTKFVSEFKARNEYGKIRNLLGVAFRKIGFYGLMFLLVFVLLSRHIAVFLKISQGPIIAIGVLLFLSFLFPLFSGMLRGLQKFKWYGASGIIQAGLKLGLGILLVSLGFGLGGAIDALNFSMAITLAIILIPLWFLFKHKKEPFDNNGMFKYSFLVLVGIEGLMLMTNMDMFLVKHFFSAVEAGYYAAASMLSKISWFASGALIAVMF